MKRFLFLLLLGSTGSSAGEAVYGDYLPESETPDASCAVLLRGHVHGSATLIGEDTLVTAAHTAAVKYFEYRRLEDLIGKEELGVPLIQVVCGKKREILTPVSATMYFRYRFDPRSPEIKPWDLMVIRTKEKSAIAPMKLPASDAELQALRKRRDCVLSGWGVDNESRDSGLHAVRIRKSEEEESGDRVEFLRFGYEKARTRAVGRTGEALEENYNRSGVGDSGSTLACKGEDGEHRLIGVVSGAFYSGDCMDSCFEYSRAVPLLKRERAWVLSFLR